MLAPKRVYVRQSKPKPKPYADLDWLEHAKARCRKQTRHFIATGQLVRKPCQWCGAEKTHAHHVVYPDVVRWFCVKCHAKVERELRESGKVCPIRDNQFWAYKLPDGAMAEWLATGKVIPWESDPQPEAPYLTFDQKLLKAG